MAGVAGRVALVTGAGSAEGIGFATARLLLAAGARVAITSTTGRIYDRLAALGAAKGDAFAMPADLTKPDQVAALLEGAEAALGPVDILVNLDFVGMKLAGAQGLQVAGAMLHEQPQNFPRSDDP